MNKKPAILCTVSLAVLAISVELQSLVRHGANSPNVVEHSSVPVDVVAGPGTVEPVSEEIKLGSELSGELKSVNVEEGDSLHKGQVLAVLENDDYRAELDSAMAEVQEKEATLRKVINGAQSRERAQSLASEQRAEAVMKNAEANLERRRELFNAGVISREELERYTKEYNVAKNEYEESADQYSLINGDTREEDVAIAQADLQRAKAQAAETQAKYEKTFMRSPIAGTVLRKHHRAGESVSASTAATDPVLTIGDTRVLRVRVDIDEDDVSKVHVGEKAYVTTDAFGKQKFWGHVVQVGELLGPKTVRSDEPTERVDRKFLETLVELDANSRLPMGLRVDAFILDPAQQTAALP